MLTNTQLLTQHVWEVNYIIYQNANAQVEYTRGGTNTTGETWGAATYTYNANGTGTFVDYSGTAYSLTWAFVPGSQNQMTYTLNYATPVTITVDDMQLTDSSYQYSFNFDASGTYDLGYVQFIPVP